MLARDPRPPRLLLRAEKSSLGEPPLFVIETLVLPLPLSWSLDFGTPAVPLLLLPWPDIVEWNLGCLHWDVEAQANETTDPLHPCDAAKLGEHYLFGRTKLTKVKTANLH